VPGKNWYPGPVGFGEPQWGGWRFAWPRGAVALGWML
jgi:hypothetical protein